MSKETMTKNPRDIIEAARQKGRSEHTELDTNRYVNMVTGAGEYSGSDYRNGSLDSGALTRAFDKKLSEVDSVQAAIELCDTFDTAVKYDGVRPKVAKLAKELADCYVSGVRSHLEQNLG